jgi:hypothetical protein
VILESGRERIAGIIRVFAISLAPIRPQLRGGAGGIVRSER